MEKFNGAIAREYKNAEISVIVEDDLIDEAKVFIDGELVEDMEISSKDNPDGIDYTRKNLDYVLGECYKVVDRHWEHLLAVMEIEM